MILILFTINYNILNILHCILLFSFYSTYICDWSVQIPRYLKDITVQRIELLNTELLNS